MSIDTVIMLSSMTTEMCIVPVIHIRKQQTKLQKLQTTDNTKLLKGNYYDKDYYYAPHHYGHHTTEQTLLIELKEANNYV